jgi:hypothetical protein
MPSGGIMEFNEILSSEYSEKFDELRKNMMIVSYYKYGAIKDNYKIYKTIDAIKSLEIRLEK